jgi:hypothetical protein
VALLDVEFDLLVVPDANLPGVLDAAHGVLIDRRAKDLTQNHWLKRVTRLGLELAALLLGIEMKRTV